MGELKLASVVVATDGSERAGRAVAFAAKLSGCFGAKLTAVHISNDASAPVAVQEQAQRCGAALKVVTSGQPAEAIVEAAQEMGADAIVLGNVGMSDRKEFLMGNVPNRVSHKANCTVIIVDTRDEKARKKSRR